jgi:hypothetical protein
MKAKIDKLVCFKQKSCNVLFCSGKICYADDKHVNVITQIIQGEVIMRNILLILACGLLVTSCRTFDTALLQPTKDSVIPKLRYLTFSESSNVLAVKEANTLDSNSYMYTLFKREVNNFVENSGDSRGKLEISITYAKVDYNFTWTLLSSLALLIPNLIGMPYYSVNAQLEFEVTVKDLKNNIVWNKIYYGKKSKAYGFYNSYADYKTLESVLLLEIFRNQITALKKDLQKDVIKINEILDKQNV